MQQAILGVDLAPGCDALLTAMALVSFRTGIVHGFGAHDLAILDDGLDGAELVVTPPGTGGADPCFF